MCDRATIERSPRHTSSSAWAGGTKASSGRSWQRAMIGWSEPCSRGSAGSDRLRSSSQEMRTRRIVPSASDAARGSSMLLSATVSASPSLK
eukprot:4457413-Prymnesium_polylepis.2